MTAKNIPIALALALVVQSVVVGIWAGNIAARTDALENTLAQRYDMAARLVRVEEAQNGIKATVESIDRRLEGLERRGGDGR